MQSKKTDIWMPLYIGDYLSATTHLSAEESGAYLHLLMHQWKNGSLPPESDSLRRIARVDRDAWSNAWSILQAFFEHSSGIPVQKRLEEIREEWDARKTTAVAKAEAAAAARWNKHASSIAQAMPQPCPSPSPSPIKNNPPRPPRGGRKVSEPGITKATKTHMMIPQDDFPAYCETCGFSALHPCHKQERSHVSAS